MSDVYESPQQGLPPHVVRTILSEHTRWRVRGDLFKKQLSKFISSESEVNALINRLAGAEGSGYNSVPRNALYFPVYTTTPNTFKQPSINSSRSGPERIPGTLVVILKFLP